VPTHAQGSVLNEGVAWIQGRLLAKALEDGRPASQKARFSEPTRLSISVSKWLVR
jgi:hypothetical protein